MRTVIDDTLADHEPVGASPTWVLSNHDVVRDVTRYGRGDTSFSMDNRRLGEFSDLELGTRRARAAALVTMALPGAVYVYQGEELGLWEVEDLPTSLLQDPIWSRSRLHRRGRDGCRVPIPWSGDASPFGFELPAVSRGCHSRPSGKPLPSRQKPAIRTRCLSCIARALHIRRAVPALAAGPLSWLPSPPGVVTFARGSEFVCIANTSQQPVALPAHDAVLLSSAADCTIRCCPLTQRRGCVSVHEAGAGHGRGRSARPPRSGGVRRRGNHHEGTRIGRRCRRQ